MYELGFCDDCKTPHLLAEDRNGGLHQPSPYAGDEFALNHENGGEDAPAELLTANAASTRLIIAGLPAAHEPYFPITLDLDSQKLGAVSATRNIGIVLTEEKDGCCSHCDHSSLGTSDFLRKPTSVRRSTLPTPYRPFWSSVLILTRWIAKAVHPKSYRGADAS